MVQNDTVRIYLSYSRLKNTYKEYLDLLSAIGTWENDLKTGDNELTEVNYGDAEAMRNEKFVVYIGADLADTKEAVFNMYLTLLFAQGLAKGLINCCDDFVSVLKGEEYYDLATYNNCTECGVDLLVFDDQYAHEASSYSGLISDYTQIIMDRSKDEEDCLTAIADALKNVTTAPVEISEETTHITDCITKQRRVEELYAQLVVYATGVKNFNDYVCEKLDPYVYSLYERNHLRSYKYDDSVIENNTFIERAVLSSLAEYGVTADDIKAAAKMDMSAYELLAYYDSFETDESRDCFTHVLRREYDEAFSNTTYAMIQDDNLMTALTKYSFSIIEVNDEGEATQASNEEFQKFMNGILYADIGYNYLPFEEHPSSQIIMKMHSQAVLLAQADMAEGLAIDPNSEGYYDYVINVNKEVGIANFYNVEYQSLKNNWGYTGSQGGQNHVGPSDHFRTTIEDFKFSNTEISYKNVNFNGSYDVSITAITSADQGASVLMEANCQELKDDYDRLLGEVFTNAASSTAQAGITAYNPVLGAAVKLVIALQGDDFSNDVDKTYKLISEYDKANGGTPTPGLSDTISISAQVLEDSYKYLKHVNDSDADAKLVSTYLFGYSYSSNYDRDDYAAGIGSFIHSIGNDNEVSSQINENYTSSINSFVRPEGIRTMENIEAGGVLTIAENNLTTTDFEYLKQRVDNNESSFSNPHLAKMLLNGEDAGERMDFSKVDYTELMTTIREINAVWHTEKNDICVETLIHMDMNNVRNTYANNQAASPELG